MSFLCGSFFNKREKIFAYFYLYLQIFYIFEKQNPTYLEFYRKSVSYNWNPWVTHFFALKTRVAAGMGIFAWTLFCTIFDIFGCEKGSPLYPLLHYLFYTFWETLRIIQVWTTYLQRYAIYRLRSPITQKAKILYCGICGIP